MFDNILTKSHSNNFEIGETGDLICYSNLFLQMLEGPSAEVHRLYEKTPHDNPRANIVKLRNEKSERRLTPSWAVRIDSHQSWILSRSEIANMSPEQAFALFGRFAKEIE